MWKTPEWLRKAVLLLKKKKNLWVVGMDQVVKCLMYKHEDRSLDPGHLHKKLFVAFL